jgi:hypothetical protein
MNKQLNIFGAILLSLAAGMTASEVISYYVERAAATEPRVNAQSSPANTSGEVPALVRVVN